jgi:hypothetical protein
MTTKDKISKDTTTMAMLKTAFRTLGLGAALAGLGAGCQAPPAEDVGAREAKAKVGQLFGPFCAQPPGTTGLPEMRPLGESPAFPYCQHLDQKALPGLAFREIFDAGDELFDTAYNAYDGAGANLAWDASNSIRFSRLPRADLPGFANRATGPNSSSCSSCHNLPIDDGGGDNGSNAIRDPMHKGDDRFYIQRNTPHVMGMGAVQRLAEEMTSDLWDLRDEGLAKAKATGTPVSVKLDTKGVSFGWIVCHSSGKISAGGLRGIDKDLVVKPFQWKGTVATIRDFVVDASHNELGMDPSELVGFGVDADHDGVKDELSVGDVTAMDIYLAGTNRPITAFEQERFGLQLTEEQRGAITAGKELFGQIGCARCHTPSLPLRYPVYYMPSRHPAYRKEVYAGGVKPADVGVDPAREIGVDLTKDPSIPFPADPATGEVQVELFSDLKRHDLGPEIAERIDETGHGASVFLTKPLWGVGSTPPYLHDGRAASLSEAIRFHGGEANASRAAFNYLSDAEKAQVIEFLNSLVLFK